MARILAPPPPPGTHPGPVPTFSVVIAAYQASATIGEAVSSALAQEPPPLEVVVSDDGSTDDLEGALEPFAGRVVFVGGGHGGEAVAKNRGFAAARGDFAVLLDADDVFLPGRIDALGRLAASRPDLDLLTTDAYLEVDGDVIGRCYHAGNPFAIDDQRLAILQRNFVFGLAAIRRPRLLEIGGFDEAIRYTADWDCWIRLVLSGSRVGLVDEPLARYRLHEKAMSARRLDMFRGRAQTLRKALADRSLRPEERAVVEQVLGAEERRVDREALDDALALGDSDVRDLARGVGRDRAQPVRSRLKGLAAWALPMAVAPLVRRERRRAWIGVGDLRVPRAGR